MRCMHQTLCGHAKRWRGGSVIQGGEEGRDTEGGRQSTFTDRYKSMIISKERGVGEPTSTNRPEFGVSSEGGIGDSTFVDPVRI